MGFEGEVEQSIGRPCRQTNSRSKPTYELTSSIVPRGTSFHHGVELEFPPIASDPLGFHTAATSLVQRNSVPSTQMRCSTANRASGSLATFTSRTILPISSTMQTLVSLTDTSNPAKWSMLRFSF